VIAPVSDPPVRLSFEQEIQSTIGLASENLLSIVDHGECLVGSSPGLFAVSEYCQDGDYRNVMTSFAEQKRPIEEIVAHVRQVLNGLRVLHTKIIHLGGRQPRTGGIMVTDYIHPAAVAADVLELRDGVRYYDGEPVRRFGLHSMRHGLATWLADRGVHPSVIQRMLRHSSPNMTMHYIHSDARKAQEELVEELLPPVSHLLSVA
jgi:integrase